MATITIDMAGFVTSFELTEADAVRILTAHTALLGPIAGLDELGQPIPATPQQVVERMAQDIVTQLAAVTRSWEQEVAASDARDQVPPLVPVLTP